MIVVIVVIAVIVVIVVTVVVVVTVVIVVIVMIVVIVGSDCWLAQTNRPTDRQTMSLIELSWTAN